MNPLWHIWLTGFCMGAADVVPGVSGGTVALLSGHYARLIGAIRGIGPLFLADLFKGRWRAAATRIDLGFLLTLGTGLAIGFAISLMTLKRLLENDSTRPATLAAFAGLIVASAWILGASLKPQGTREQLQSWVSILIGTIIAACVVSLPEATEQSAPSLPFVFLCGAIGICAMILPGISGAMLLLMIGIYPYLITMPHKLLHGEASEAIPVIVTFGAGCAIGILLFSRVLHFLLETKRLATTSILVGLMIGSIVRLWPFRAPVTDPESHVTPGWIWPDFAEMSTWIVVAAFLLGIVAIFAIQGIAVRSAKPTASVSSPTTRAD